MRSLALGYPSVVRDNDYYRRTQPEVLARFEETSLAKFWKKGEEGHRDTYQQAMMPYMEDPFRGTIHRRVLAEKQRALDLELDAARQAIDKAGLTTEEIDLVISASFLPDQVGIGNAPFLCRELGTVGAGWNLETACSGSTVGYQTACALVSSGQYRNVLVVVSCTYSLVSDDRETFTWFIGDGAAAFVVGQVQSGSGYLGGKTIHTGTTCDTVSYRLVPDRDGATKIQVHASPKTGDLLTTTAQPFFQTCARGALAAAGIEPKDLDFVVVNTPTAWYHTFAARVLGLPEERTISTYEHFANTGPVLMPTNLYYAAARGRISPGDLVLVYSVGSVSSSSAAVMRWTDVALGRDPLAAPVS